MEKKQIDNDVFKALEFAAIAMEHDVPDSCYATGPMTGDPVEDLLVCPACRALAHINPILVASGEYRWVNEKRESIERIPWSPAALTE